MFKLDLGKAEEPEIKFLCWIIEKAREFQKNIDSCFIDYANSFDCVHHNKLWKILQEMTISYLLTCFLTRIQISLEVGKVIWYSHPLKNFPQFTVIHTVKGFDIVNKADVDVFPELTSFFDIQWI